MQLAKAFDTWRMFSEARARRRYTNAIAIRHLYTKLVTKHLEAWKEYTIGERNKHKADSFCKRMTQLRYVNRWKSFIGLIRKEAAQRTTAQVHLITKLLGKTFQVLEKSIIANSVGLVT